MSPEKSEQKYKICPTCGTRLSESATRCLVCGRTFEIESKKPASKVSKNEVKGPKMPELTLSLPVALGLMFIVLAVGAGIVFAVLQGTGRVVEPTVTPTQTTTATQTLTPTATSTGTPEPTFTPLPPIEYQVKSGDYCSSIAAFFNVSVQSIVLLNNLSADCTDLSVGQTLQIPQPTPTASPMPTATLSQSQSTEEACEKYSYTVTENDTLIAIAANFNVSMDAIKEWNGLTTDIVYQGQPLTIPLCARNPTPGPTPTPTLPPPYSAPNLLLPADGEAFTSANSTVTLQWASVGTLRANEAYAVHIQDVTGGTNLTQVEYVTDTKLIVPAQFRPTDNSTHILRWWVSAVRQSGSTSDGQPIWEDFGAASIQRVFSWTGSGSGAAPATPAP